MIARTALCIVLAISPWAAQASTHKAPEGEFVRSPDLLKACLINPPAYGNNRDWCNGYLEAVADYLSVPGKGLIALKACVSDDTSPSDLRDIAVAFMKAHPAKEDDNAANTVSLALSKAWPCR